MSEYRDRPNERQDRINPRSTPDSSPYDAPAENSAPVHRTAQNSRRVRSRSEPQNHRGIVLAAIVLLLALAVAGLLMIPGQDVTANADIPQLSLVPAPSPTPEVICVTVQATPEVVYVESTPEVVYIESTPEVVYVESTPKIIYVTPEPYQTIASAGYVRATGDVYLRTGPARRYDTIGVLKNGSRAEYLGQRQLDERGVAWYLVRYGGNTGWVSSRYSQPE